MTIASGHFIPAGRIQHLQPTLPASAETIADERDRIRGLTPADKTLYDLSFIPFGVLNLSMPIDYNKNII